MMLHLTWLVALAISVPATAFGTINEPVVLGQHNEHEMITRLAFQCPSGQKSDGVCFEPRSLDQLAGYHRDVLGYAITGAGFNGAVGSPDTLDPVPEGPEAHCDNADYLDVPDYPQTRAQATANLQACIDHLRYRFRQAWESAARLLDERRRIRSEMVDISNPFLGDCKFAFAALQGDAFGRAKCNAIEGLGRALHGVQDFYSHSNWADRADPTKPISVSNPPGLAVASTAPFLDLRAKGPIPADQIPLNLTTGCFALPDSSPGTGDCEGRITHYALSKDNGFIHLDGTFGEVGPSSPRSEASPDNFQLAVEAAIQSSRDVWAALQDEIRHRYGAVSGNLMICALVRDTPVKDCRNRTVAVALDKSSGSGINQGVQLEQVLAQELNSRLTMHGLDKVAVIEYDETARLVYPMGYPKSATFGFSEPSRQRHIGSGLRLAIAENIYAQPETYTDRGAVLLLSTGSENDLFSEDTLAQIERANEEGIRVHYGCINVAALTDEGANSQISTKCTLTLSNALVPKVLETGGIVAFIDSPMPRTPGHFIDLIMDRGLTATDDADAAENTRIYPDIILVDRLSADNRERRFEYPVSVDENLNFTIRNYAPQSRDTEGCFSVILWNKELDIKIATYTSCSSAEPLFLVYEALAPLELVLVAQYQERTTEGRHASTEGVIFTVQLETTMPEKNETATKKTSTNIASSRKAVELPGSCTWEVLTTETLEMLTSTATVGESTTTAPESLTVGYDGGVFYAPTFHPVFMDFTETIWATTAAAGNLSSASNTCAPSRSE
ncbi:hypothetical protein VTK26DRAFT_8148 [Humicola hyalothermophila]